ncbi:hypothetical protein HGRIS_011456 [Hohenbuehelia grisea]|uniref:Gag protein n=1 Tax=Hohenbuehelia grisea TaxID=104357 RepID=A0ABR3JW77_9AGAR
MPSSISSQFTTATMRVSSSLQATVPHHSPYYQSGSVAQSQNPFRSQGPQVQRISSRSSDPPAGPASQPARHARIASNHHLPGQPHATISPGVLPHYVDWIALGRDIHSSISVMINEMPRTIHGVEITQTVVREAIATAFRESRVSIQQIQAWYDAVDPCFPHHEPELVNPATIIPLWIEVQELRPSRNGTPVTLVKAAFAVSTVLAQRIIPTSLVQLWVEAMVVTRNSPAGPSARGPATSAAHLPIYTHETFADAQAMPSTSESMSINSMGGMSLDAPPRVRQLTPRMPLTPPPSHSRKRSSNSENIPDHPSPSKRSRKHTAGTWKPNLYSEPRFPIWNPPRATPATLKYLSAK